MRKKNIYLIQAGFAFDQSLYFPCAAGALAAYALQDAVIRERYVFKDFIFRREKLDEAAGRMESPFLAGFSCCVWNYEYNKALAKKIKARNGKNINRAVLEVLKSEIGNIKPILFSGDNYSREWEAEAKKRDLPNEKTTPGALKALITTKAFNLFEKYQVLSRAELKSRYLIHVGRFIKDLEIEVKCLNNICMSQVIPAAVTYQKRLAETLLLTRQALGAKAAVPAETELLKNVTDLINTIYSLNKEIQARVDAAETIQEAPRKAEALDVRVRPKMDELRECVDALENLIDDELWPLPKFWEMLFIS